MAETEFEVGVCPGSMNLTSGAQYLAEEFAGKVPGFNGVVHTGMLSICTSCRSQNDGVTPLSFDRHTRYGPRRLVSQILMSGGMEARFLYYEY